MKKLLYTVIAILGFANLTMAQVPSYVPTNGLVGYWPFNGNANDESGNGNNGTVNGAVLVSDRKGASNKAYSFDGINDVISIPDNSTFESNRHSISFWIKYSNLPSSRFDILGKDNSSGNRQFIVQLESTGKVRTALFTDSTNAILDTREPLKSSLWSHVVVAYDSSYYEIYINGVSDTAMFTKGNLLQASIPLNIGGTPSFNQYFKGEIDDVCFWNRALSSNEVNVLYTQCKDTFTIQPSNLSGAKGTNKNLSFTHSGTGYNNKWQSNSNALGWQNVPNANQYSGVTTNSLAVNGLTVSNHNQLFRVISSKQGCADTSNVVKLTVSDVATDSLNVISLKTDTTTKGNTIRQLQNDSISKLGTITSLKTDTTNKGNTIRQLQTDLANKHDTLYVGSTITTDTLKISIRTGISMASPVINSLKVYPNPASTLLNIVLEKPGYYVAKLSSVTGQSIIAPTSGTIDISALANGVYILTIYDSNNKLISTNKVSIIK